MIRKHIISSVFLFLVLCLVTSCGVSGDKVRIKGTFKNLKQTDCFVYSEDGLLPRIETIHVVDGEFDFECTLPEKAIINFVLPNYTILPIIAEPGKTIRMKVDAGRLAETEVTGTEENEMLTTFRLGNIGKKENDVRLAAAQFVHDNPGTLAALALFRKYYAEVEQIDIRSAQPLLAVLEKSQGKNIQLQNTKRFVESLTSAAIGQAIGKFELQTVDGKTLTQDDFAGTPFIICFAAAWNGESYPMVGKIKELGRMEGNPCRAVVLSFDTDEKRAREFFIHQGDELLLVCDGKGIDSPLMQRFSVRYIPGNVIVDKKGVIIARDLSVEALEKQVRAL